MYQGTNFELSKAEKAEAEVFFRKGILDRMANDMDCTALFKTNPEGNYVDPMMHLQWQGFLSCMMVQKHYAAPFALPPGTAIVNAHDLYCFIMAAWENNLGSNELLYKGLSADFMTAINRSKGVNP